MRAEVKALCDRLSIDAERAFNVWYARSRCLDDQEALEATSYDGGNDRGIDVFYLYAETGESSGITTTPVGAKSAHILGNDPLDASRGEPVRDDDEEDHEGAARARQPRARE